MDKSETQLPEAVGTNPHEVIAAVDLGSNSFHMIVARVADGRLHVLDHMREMVQLAAGLTKKDLLTEAAQKRALACLARFGQRLRHMRRGSVRAVGTQTLRRAANARAFLNLARRALGHPIEIIGGAEEARLIYGGVAHTLPNSPERRLVIDIGGGSTELIIGQGFEALHTESLAIGCVSLTKAHFADGAISDENLARAGIAAGLELQNIERQFRDIGWGGCIGASGTVNAIQAVVRANKWSDGDITAESLARLRDALLKAGHVRKLSLAGLRAERAPIFPAGVAILAATFVSLGIERLRAADGALREGLLYDLLGRMRHEDVRDRTIDGLCTRYHVDSEHGRRVERTVCDLLAQVAPRWQLNREDDANMLGWAARLHEVGLTIAHSQYHKHGAYLIANTDMPGFSRQEQELLAALVRGHRRKFPAAVFRELPRAVSLTAARLAMILRLAVLLHRARSRRPLPPLTLTATGKTLRLSFPPGWLAEHPLTQADLAQEAEYLNAAGMRLKAESLG